MYIIWIPTWKCNYAGKWKCPYCDYIWKNNGLEVDCFQGYRKLVFDRELTAKEWLDFVNSLEPSHFDFTGGEPLLYDGFLELINNLSDKHVWAITSNTSLLPLYLDKLNLEKCISWTASYHPYAPYPYSSPAWFIKRIKELKSRGVPVTITIVAYPPMLHLLDELVEYFERVCTVNVNLFYNRFFDWKEHPDLLERVKKHIDKTAFGQKWYKLELKKKDKVKMCNAGKKYAVFMPNGDVIRCYSGWVIDYDRYKIGNITDSNFKFLSKEKECDIPCIFPCDYQQREVYAR